MITVAATTTKRQSISSELQAESGNAAAAAAADEELTMPVAGTLGAGQPNGYTFVYVCMQLEGVEGQRTISGYLILIKRHRIINYLH